MNAPIPRCPFVLIYAREPVRQQNQESEMPRFGRNRLKRDTGVRVTWSTFSHSATAMARAITSFFSQQFGVGEKKPIARSGGRAEVAGMALAQPARGKGINPLGMHRGILGPTAPTYYPCGPERDPLTGITSRSTCSCAKIWRSVCSIRPSSSRAASTTLTRG